MSKEAKKVIEKLQNIGTEVEIDTKIQLPGLNRPIRDFAMDTAKVFKESEDIFYKPNENIVVEIDTFYDKLMRRNVTSFRKVTPKRFLNLIEERATTFIYVKDKFDDLVQTPKSPNENVCSVLLENEIFLSSLSKVNRFLHYPLIFLDVHHNIIIPEKGYDKRFQAYFTKDMPEIQLMNLKDAKDILERIFKDFCFKDQIDKTMAYAYLLTPACRGLYKTITARTPIFLIKANRERAGKDYLAGIVGIIYEGRAIDDPPICTGERGSQGNEELRKKITSSIRQGRRRIHSSNNRGHIQNAVLEQLSTSETWRDRELGKNSEFTLENELDISLSANIGITYTPDFWYRCRGINLFFSEENPNSRTFELPDLWGYVKENRGLVLSAIYTLIIDWVKKGMPISDKAIFTSFPEWARVVGSIMIHHDLGNPCEEIIDDAIGGDRETKDMKKVFEMLSKLSQAKEGFTPNEIMENIKEYQNEESVFSYYDFNERKYKTKFGILLQKYLGREFSGIIMTVDDPSQRAARRKYFFKEIEKVGKVGKVGNDLPPHELNENNNNIIKSSQNPTKVTRLPKFSLENQILQILENFAMFEIHELLKKSAVDENIVLETITKMKKEGMIFEPRSGFIQKL